jgi:hypothetical protein
MVSLNAQDQARGQGAHKRRSRNRERPATQYAAGGSPFMGQPKMVNPAVYLGSGRDFGALIPDSAHIALP